METYQKPHIVRQPFSQTLDQGVSDKRTSLQHNNFDSYLKKYYITGPSMFTSEAVEIDLQFNVKIIFLSNVPLVITDDNYSGQIEQHKLKTHTHLGCSICPQYLLAFMTQGTFDKNIISSFSTYIFLIFTQKFFESPALFVIPKSSVNEQPQWH